MGKKRVHVTISINHKDRTFKPPTSKSTVQSNIKVSDLTNIKENQLFDLFENHHRMLKTRDIETETEIERRKKKRITYTKSEVKGKQR